MFKWMDKEDVVYIYTMEYYLTIKNEWNNAICSNVYGPRDYHTKWNVRQRQISYDITNMWRFKKIQMNIFTKQKYSHRCGKQISGYQWGKGGGGINWETGVDICTLLYIK